MWQTIASSSVKSAENFFSVCSKGVCSWWEKKAAGVCLFSLQSAGRVGRGAAPARRAPWRPPPSQSRGNRPAQTAGRPEKSEAEGHTPPHHPSHPLSLHLEVGGTPPCHSAYSPGPPPPPFHYGLIYFIHISIVSKLLR